MKSLSDTSGRTSSCTPNGMNCTFWNTPVAGPPKAGLNEFWTGTSPPTRNRARSPDSDWAGFYAERFMECYGPSESPAEDQLALYYMAACPFCIYVMRAIARLGLDVEMRNVVDDLGFRDELIEARGRATVPVLRIESPNGKVRWMPESRDIIRYLDNTYGQD